MLQQHFFIILGYSCAKLLHKVWYTLFVVPKYEANAENITHQGLCMQMYNICQRLKIAATEICTKEHSSIDQARTFLLGITPKPQETFKIRKLLILRLLVISLKYVFRKQTYPLSTENATFKMTSLPSTPGQDTHVHQVHALYAQP